MKNIVVITPFYPYPENKKLKKDSNAVYYLVSNKNLDENIIIVYYYQHTRINAIKNFPRILKNKNYQECLFKDDKGNDVLLFEHPCLIPHSFRTFLRFDRKYADFLESYLKDRGITIDSLIVHFPVRFSPFASLINAKRKVAICHSFDVEKGRDRITKNYNEYYDAIGFRSPQIRSIYHKGEKFHDYLCLSGVPDSYLNRKRDKRCWRDNGKLRICFAGKLVKNKNVDSVIYALKQIENRCDFVFSIIGTGEKLKELQEITKHLRLENKVSFLGSMSRENVYEEFLQNDVFIMTSYKETLGLVYLEAMAAGNLIIASKDRGIDGIVNNNQGILFVDPRSVDSIASAIEEYANMPLGDVKKLQSEVSNIIKQYSESSVSRLYLDMACGNNIGIREETI